MGNPRFEAIVFAGDPLPDPIPAADGISLAARIAEALEAGIELVLVEAAGAFTLAADGRRFQIARDALGDPTEIDLGTRVSADSGHDSGEEPGHLASRWLWSRGVAPAQILAVGPLRPGLAAGERVPGGRVAFERALARQVAARRHRELPVTPEDADWVVVIDGVDPLLERSHESVLTIADGRLGTRGSLLSVPERAQPMALMSGVYTRAGAETHLLAAPRWNAIALSRPAGTGARRVLDLHSGLLYQHLSSGDGEARALLFSSLARPGTTALRVRDTSGTLRRQPPLVAPGPDFAQGRIGGDWWMRVSGRPGSIVTAAHEQLRVSHSARVLDRLAAYEGSRDGGADRGAARARLHEARARTFEGLLAEHRRAWAARWEASDIGIDGDPDLQRAVRFSLFHLLGAVPDRDEAAVGARGLSGGAYHGHVFWDSDVYVLPFLAAANPPAARAMLEYRVRRLPAAMRAARAAGRDGARFPWESAHSGQDVTPRWGRDPHGRRVPIRTGSEEEHIIADVAWAAVHYVDWTADGAFARGPGRELLVQTARWWATRIERDEDGSGHIRHVIGPDEYHEDVDDNAFTNLMARSNLRRAAGDAESGIDPEERRRWRELADALVDGYDPATGIYEQFAGFHALEPLIIAEAAPRRPVAADMLLGYERVRGSQVVKQADVLMAHYLDVDEVRPGSLVRNLDFYEPRTAHGSTLSPGVHAALLARAGRAEQAAALLGLTARIDLDDIGNMTAGGLHLAAMGSVWRAIVFGYAGIRIADGIMEIAPRLPASWERLDLRLRVRGSRVRVHCDPAEVRVAADPPIAVRWPDGEVTRVGRRLGARSERGSAARLRRDG